MKKQYLKGFSQFVNENLEHEEDQQMNSYGEELWGDYEKQDELIARALGCDPSELDRYNLGSPVNMDSYDPEHVSMFDEVKDLFTIHGDDNYNWNLKKKGRIIYHIEVGAPDGFSKAHYFHYDGKRVVVVEEQDGPFIYLKHDD